MNPCQGVKQFKEQARTRYISDREYDALYKVASIPVKVAMELAYLCCARQGDILDLKKSQILSEGILIQQSKTAVSQIKAWTKRLEDAVNLAGNIPLNSGMVSIFVIHQPSGLRYTRDAFNAQWMKTKKLAAEKFPDLDFQFTFHDLKAKGISDLEGTLSEKQEISGHKNASQTARYNRRISVVPVVGGQ
jgi:integrase